jgi:hypothetical protein
VSGATLLAALLVLLGWVVVGAGAVVVLGPYALVGWGAATMVAGILLPV